MFEKKIFFQDVEVRAKRIKTYIDISFNYPELCEEYLEKNLNKNEKNIALAIVSGEALDTISDGIFISQNLNPNTRKIKKQVTSIVEEVFVRHFLKCRQCYPFFLAMICLHLNHLILLIKRQET